MLTPSSYIFSIDVFDFAPFKYMLNEMFRFFDKLWIEFMIRNTVEIPQILRRVDWFWKDETLSLHKERLDALARRVEIGHLFTGSWIGNKCSRFKHSSATLL